MATFIATPTVGVGSNNPAGAPIGIATSFKPVVVPNGGTFINPLPIGSNNASTRPTFGQLFPLGLFQGGNPMSQVDGVIITTVGTTTTTIPLTVTSVYLGLTGPGGPGGAGTGSTGAGGGGGGGGFTEGWYPVTAGSTLTTVLSATGTCSITGMVSGTCTATAGATGASSNTTGAAGGAGGSGSGGTVIGGQQGGASYAIGSIPASGVGGASGSGSGGGTLTVAGAVGNPGQSPGGGGSGGSGIHAGGAGGRPQAVISWAQ